MAFLEFFFQGEVFTKEWTLIAFRMANYSQGVFAFLILICNGKTLRGIFKGEWNLKGNKIIVMIYGYYVKVHT